VKPLSKMLLLSENGSPVSPPPHPRPFTTWAPNENREAVDSVILLLEMMAANDDFYVAEHILIKMLCHAHPSRCQSWKHGFLWIVEAARSNAVVQFKRNGVKARLVCLTNNHKIATEPYPQDDISLSKEEEYVRKVLMDHNGWMTRIDVIQSLMNNFESMYCPLNCKKVFHNGCFNRSFFGPKIFRVRPSA
jgi:hypothetical protein